MKNNILKKAAFILQDMESECIIGSWSEFEAEYSVYHEAIGNMIDIAINANLNLNGKYLVSDQEEWLYWYIDDNRNLVEISEVEYYKKYLEYVETIETGDIDV